MPEDVYIDVLAEQERDYTDIAVTLARAQELRVQRLQNEVCAVKDYEYERSAGENADIVRRVRAEGEDCIGTNGFLFVALISDESYILVSDS
ncbi:hypothetical protein VNI00_015376 [Paramarasmius palmivorus]|uniref:Uncharacterized protein n=1 Tax=Paramarasmius palmivorus TaxID=297713 RepID=A0AAW0BLJ4_9AGAR